MINNSTNKYAPHSPVLTVSRTIRSIGVGIGCGVGCGGARGVGRHVQYEGGGLSGKHLQRKL